MLEGIGRTAALEGDRNDGSEVLKLWFVTPDNLLPAKLKALLTDHLSGFRIAFADGSGEKEAG